MTDRQAYRQADEQTDRQTNKHTNRQTELGFHIIGQSLCNPTICARPSLGRQVLISLVKIISEIILLSVTAAFLAPPKFRPHSEKTVHKNKFKKEKNCYYENIKHK
jgi:hypothetical protein